MGLLPAECLIGYLSGRWEENDILPLICTGHCTGKFFKCFVSLLLKMTVWLLIILVYRRLRVMNLLKVTHLSKICPVANSHFCPHSSPFSFLKLLSTHLKCPQYYSLLYRENSAARIRRNFPTFSFLNETLFQLEFSQVELSF